MTTSTPLALVRLFLLSLLLLVLAARPASATLRVERIFAPCLAGDRIGNPDTLVTAVYLPPGYADQVDRRYPVLYLLHGIEGTYEDWTKPGYGGFRIQDAMDSLIAFGRIRAMIVVVPTGKGRRYTGSFYVNSPTQGNWEDCVTRDLVGAIDAKYRTLADPSSRGIAGHSMGGFGAIHLGMRHPDVFGAVYAMSPCCLGIAKDLSPENTAWVRALALQSWDDYDRALRSEDFYPPAIVSLLAAFLPDPARPPFYVDFPYRLTGGKIVSREPFYAKYRAAFPLYSIDRYAENLGRLRGLAMDFGPRDQFEHIPPTVTAFSQELARRGIPHTFEVYPGDHRERIGERMTAVVLPYFSRMLAPQP